MPATLVLRLFDGSLRHVAIDRAIGLDCSREEAVIVEPERARGARIDLTDAGVRFTRVGEVGPSLNGRSVEAALLQHLDVITLSAAISLIFLDPPSRAPAAAGPMTETAKEQVAVLAVEPKLPVIGAVPSNSVQSHPQQPEATVLGSPTGITVPPSIVEEAVSQAPGGVPPATVLGGAVGFIPDLEVLQNISEPLPAAPRSEERRVGKEWRYGLSREA